MARTSKWIKGTNPNQPVTEVAQRALIERLSTVWRFAPLAARRHADEIEYVHQLRVATRRARAALEIFEDLLPKRKAQWIKQELHALRRSAGDARDLDVLGQRLEAAAAENKGSHLRDVLKQVAKKRRKAQKPVTAAYKRAKSKRFKKRSGALAMAVRWRGDQPEPSLAEVARTTLTRLVDDFVSAAEADLSDTQALHQMRISGKQVRYALEVLAGAFDSSCLERVYPIFEEVQEKLGAINDHATAITMYTAWLRRTDSKRGRNELADLIASEQQSLDRECRDFRHWWTASRSAELKRRFREMLSGSETPGSPGCAASQKPPRILADEIAIGRAAGLKKAAQRRRIAKASATV